LRIPVAADRAVRLFPSESFANALAQLGVTPAALAAGYATFFVYAGLLGVAAIALALIIVVQEARRERGLPEATKTPT
jgi:hypothetical protein